jgi:hypothetical protein
MQTILTSFFSSRSTTICYTTALGQTHLLKEKALEKK